MVAFRKTARLCFQIYTLKSGPKQFLQKHLLTIGVILRLVKKKIAFKKLKQPIDFLKTPI